MLNQAAFSGARGPSGPLLVALVATLVATVLSYALPEAHAATGVGLWFLVLSYFLVLRQDDTAVIRQYGLSLGGLFEPEPLDPARLAKATLAAVAPALILAAVAFPLFWIGFVAWYRPAAAFVPAPLTLLLSDVLGQLLGIAFPEEVFFRGYLQSALDRAWPKSRVFLGAELGPGLLLSSAVFAAGHYLTEPALGRLAVFFPSLVFGFLRARTGGVGSAIVFHALCNLFATYLGRSYGLLS